MKVHLVKIEGYEAAINALRMSTGKFYSYEKLRDIQQLVWLMTDDRGFLNDESRYRNNFETAMWTDRERTQRNSKVTGIYQEDLLEFKRLLGLTKNQAMGENNHHTLMMYLDITFITEDMHRGAQDDLDAHAKSFDNRITRFSTRLAEFDNVELSDWYKDKVITFAEVDSILGRDDIRKQLPTQFFDGEKLYIKTPFGYVLEKHSQVPAKNGLDKDVQRGLMPLGMKSTAQWKANLHSLRYVYMMRSKKTKANPELKEAMEQLADLLEEHLPVFGEHFRYVQTATGEWEHLSSQKIVSRADFELLKRVKKESGE